MENATHFIEVFRLSDCYDIANRVYQGKCNNINYLETFLLHTTEANLKTIAIFKIKPKNKN